MKLFSVIKDEHMNRIKVNFLGIRFKMSTEKNALRGIIDSLYAKTITPLFIMKNKKYIQNKKDSVMRRLFITTGNINLVNNLAIIEQLNLKENSNNDIFVWSGLANQDFLDLSKQVCEKFGINKFYSFIGSSKNFHQYLIKNFFTDYDEIYFVNLDALGKIIHKIYKYSILNITDEGACTLVPIKSINYSKISRIITANYLGKIDYIGYPNNISKKIIELDKKEFLKVSNVCSKLRPLEFDIKTNDRWIIFCGTFSGWKGATFEDIIECQNEIIETLKTKGYKILFKPHPRDTFNYKESENFKIFNTRLSLECYELKNVMAVVSVFSSVSLQIYHYQGIPSFIVPEKIQDIEDVSYRLITHYAPSVELLYAIDTNCSDDELQKRIVTVYTNWLKDKPKMSENLDLIKLYEETK